ncbi:MAG: DUF4190 domain-containing protein [Clostridia bacterium]|nr:DUF4190 domain-containing protein [Clostridia bacterium]
MKEKKLVPADYKTDDEIVSKDVETEEEDNSIYYTAPEPAEFDSDAGKGVGIASMVLGILSILFCCCCCCNIIFIAPALICAIIGINKRKGNGFAIAGLILSIVAAILTAIFTFYVLSIDITNFEEISRYSESEQGETPTFEELFKKYNYGSEEDEEASEQSEDSEASEDTENGDFDEEDLKELQELLDWLMKFFGASEEAQA